MGSAKKKSQPDPDTGIYLNPPINLLIFLAGSEPGPDIYSISKLNKKAYSGYHCFIEQYQKAKTQGKIPLKLPNGTIW